MIHQTFVRWAFNILFKFAKSLIRHLGLAIGNVWCVRWFSWTLEYPRMHIWCKFGDSDQICNTLLHGQTKFPRILSQNGQNDLEGQWPPFSIPAESIPRGMFGANLVIPPQTCDELSSMFQITASLSAWSRQLWRRTSNFLKNFLQSYVYDLRFKAEGLTTFFNEFWTLLSCGQSKVYGRTDRQTQATTIPLRPERPTGKTISLF